MCFGHHISFYNNQDKLDNSAQQSSLIIAKVITGIIFLHFLIYLYADSYVIGSEVKDAGKTK